MDTAPSLRLCRNQSANMCKQTLWHCPLEKPHRALRYTPGLVHVFRVGISAFELWGVGIQALGLAFRAYGA